MRKLLVAAVVLALAGSAQAATPFGANVEAAPATSSFLCGGPLPPFGFNSGVPTCTATTAGLFGSGAGSLLVPNGFGVITRVDVRMPNATGPMQITVLRAIRSAISTIPACCFHAGESQAFTPPPGVVSSQAVRIPVKSELTPTNVFEYDALAISALSAQTPIPAAPLANQSSGGYFPAVSRGQERFESQAALGENQIMLRGIWEPDADRDGFGDETQDGCPGNAGAQRRGVARAAQCGGGPPAGGGGTTTPAPSATTVATTTPATVTPVARLVVGARSATVRAGRAAVALRCGATPCRGTMRLQSRAAGRRGAKTFATAAFRIPANSTRTVNARLNAAGRALLRRRRTATVFVNVTGAVTLTTRVTLRRA